MSNDRRHLLGAILVMTVAWALWVGVGPEPAALQQDADARAAPLDLPAVPASPVVEVISSGGRGTGFFISPSGLLVTAEHVVDEARTGERDVLVGYELSGMTMPGRVVARDPWADLALVQVEAPPFAGHLSFEHLEIETDSARWLASVAPGRALRVWSCPDGVCVPDVFEVYGSVSALTSEDVRIFAHPGIVPGMSGSPVLDDDDRVVGVVATGGGMESYFYGREDWDLDGGLVSILCLLNLVDVAGDPAEPRVRDDPVVASSWEDACGLGLDRL